MSTKIKVGDIVTPVGGSDMKKGDYIKFRVDNRWWYGRVLGFKNNQMKISYYNPYYKEYIKNASIPVSAARHVSKARAVKARLEGIL